MKAYCDQLCKVVKELDDEMSRPENLKNFRREAQEIICKRKFEDPEVIKNQFQKVLTFSKIDVFVHHEMVSLLN